jgi:hypothetical protein
VSEATDVVENQVKAFNQRDVDKFVECYSPAAVIKDGDGNVLMSGAESITGMYGQLFRDSPDLNAEIPNRMAVGQYVIDEEQLTGFVMPGYPTEVHAVVIYRVDGPVITEVTLLM